MGARVTKSALVCAALSILWAGAAFAQAQDHLKHITDSWKDTPGSVGLLAILEQEAQTAASHAKYALGDKKDVSTAKTHIPHVQNAIDPSIVTKGPGKGYGALKAAQGIAQHMGFAANAPDASDGLKMHSVHVITSATNVVDWCNQIMAKSAKVFLPGMDKDAMQATAEIADMTQWILNGHDANGDGKISWEKGEGGIAQLKQHLGFIK